MPVTISSSSSSSAALLAQRRQREGVQRSNEEYVLSQRKADQKRQWEDRMERNAVRKDVFRRVQSMEEEDEEYGSDGGTNSTRRRKDALRTLYGTEMSNWITDVKRKQSVTTEEVMGRIRSRAMSLKERREDERRGYVAECYDRQWRESCDEARTIESRLVSERRMEHDRKALDDSRKKNGRDEEDEKEVRGLAPTRKAGAEDSKDLQDEGDDQENEMESERKKKRDRNLETKLALDAQIELLNSTRNQEQERIQMEEWGLINRWKDQIDAAAREERRANELNRARGTEMLRFNNAKLEARKRDAEMERCRDSIVLNIALKKERRDVNEETSKGQRDKNEAREYVSYLREQMERDANDESRIESIRNAELDKIWSGRDREMQVRDEARRRLEYEIDECRREQMRQKIEQIGHERECMKDYVRREMEELHARELEEKEASIRAKEVAINYMKENIDTAVRKDAERKDWERMERLIMNSEIQREEKAYRERLDRIRDDRGGDERRMHHPLKHAQWYT